MPDREPTTQTVKASEARAQWSRLINKVARRQSRFIVEKSGIPVAAIVSADDLARLNHLEQERRRDFAIIDESRTAFRDVPDEELEREVSKALAEVRAEHRQRRSPADSR